MKTLTLALSLLALGTFAPRSLAQAPPPVVSPEVTPAGSVTLRILAPNARTVTASGSWDNWKSRPLTKSESGAWSVTIDSLAPDIYEYSFTIDGQQHVDPKNSNLRPFTSRVEVTGGRNDLIWQPQETPRGTIHAVSYPSRPAGFTRRVHVYTPPGYEAGKTRYPVLFLLHGSGDDDSSWSSGLGRAGVILDNLIARKQAVPMIVVMPDGHVRAPGKTFPPETFERDLVEEIVPLVDRTFRTGRERAICGLSMGGGQTVTAGMAHPELFSAFGVFSAGIWQGNDAAFERGIGALERASRKPPFLIWIGIGKEDFLYERSNALRARLTKGNLPFTYVETGGGHVWQNWRRYLAEFVPLLFRGRK